MRTKKQQIMRIDKTAQDRLPAEQRPRVKAARARLVAMQAQANAERELRA